MHIILFSSLLILSSWQLAVWFKKRQQSARLAMIKLAAIKHDHKKDHKHQYRMGEQHGR